MKREKENSIPFKLIKKVNDISLLGDYDYITFSQSPNYTPKSLDVAIDMIKKYTTVIYEDETLK